MAQKLERYRKEQKLKKGNILPEQLMNPPMFRNWDGQRVPLRVVKAKNFARIRRRRYGRSVLAIESSR